MRKWFLFFLLISLEFLLEMFFFLHLQFSMPDPASNLSFDFIEKNFVGKVKTTTKCISCETESVREEDVVHITVHFPEENEKKDSKNFIKVSKHQNQWQSKSIAVLNAKLYSFSTGSVFNQGIYGK